MKTKYFAFDKKVKNTLFSPLLSRRVELSVRFYEVKPCKSELLNRKSYFQFDEIYDDLVGDNGKSDRRCRCFDHFNQVCDNLSSASEEDSNKHGNKQKLLFVLCLLLKAANTCSKILRIVGEAEMYLPALKNL